MERCLAGDATDKTGRSDGVTIDLGAQTVKFVVPHTKVQLRPSKEQEEIFRDKCGPYVAAPQYSRPYLMFNLGIWYLFIFIETTGTSVKTDSLFRL